MGSLQLLGVPLQLGQIVERIGSVQLAGMDQTHEQIADSGAVQRLVEECVFSVKDGLFQNSFDQIVIDRGPWFTKEKSQRHPVAKHVPDGLSPELQSSAPSSRFLTRSASIQSCKVCSARSLRAPMNIGHMVRSKLSPRTGIVYSQKYCSALSSQMMSFKSSGAFNVLLLSLENNM